MTVGEFRNSKLICFYYKVTIAKHNSTVYDILISNSMAIMERKYLSIKEAATYLGVSALTLRNWDKQGKLGAYRNPINNYRVYRLDQLELFLRSIESPGSAPRAQQANITTKIHIRTDGND
ncbi:MAG: hypothetical protein A3H64_02315 [Candidatus Ryanbacteria bacterium RIFCSPLOWO2_02_FULL_45_11c]|uniref:HTH merR-type domain-containing protein n=1 Tax=Candidatus Ryanbacteria bacterium RIFCSPLOWO2_02_FULL_45_11c TaxID=1802128 RepID=A0A1G2H2M2_9BACT|nr:MAG: hypothetical protein A3H64_02315 [Candidatus Ryanbacteria bacterium RIFCSPLOWO2_02_FULL_45_11c]